MTVQRWISENYFAASVPRRGLAFAVKIGIEGGLSMVVGASITVPVYLILVETQYSPPFHVAGPVVLWMTFTGVVFTRAWCLLTRERTSWPTG